MSKENYNLIPILEISERAREVAVLWIENYQPGGGFEIQQKHKLASDIDNVAKQEAIAFHKFVSDYFGPRVQTFHYRPNDPDEFEDKFYTIEELYQLFKQQV